jgi:glutathione peroxidase
MKSLAPTRPIWRLGTFAATTRNPFNQGARSLYVLAFLLAASCDAQSQNNVSTTQARAKEMAANFSPQAANVYGHQVTDIDGKAVPLERYKGKISLVVNTASECGYTSQYGDLEQLYRAYRERGFEILAFPSNDFGGQEPNDEAFIKAFTADNFGVSFPLFAKTRTRGPGKSPLYQTLTEEGPAESRGEIAWNFTKFLVGPQGEILARFGSSTSPSSPELRAALEKALDERPTNKAKAPTHSR